MFGNLKAEFVKNNKKPYSEIARVLNCTEKTASNKLKGTTNFTVTEAQQILKSCFPNLTLDYLFAADETTAEKNSVQKV